MGTVVSPRAGVRPAPAPEITRGGVGGAIGCSQVDSFLTFTDVTSLDYFDVFTISLTATDWLFADSPFGEAEDAFGLNFFYGISSGASLTGSFDPGLGIGNPNAVSATFGKLRGGSLRVEDGREGRLIGLRAPEGAEPWDRVRVEVDMSRRVPGDPGQHHGALGRHEGLFWSWVVPAALFALAFGATWLLYRSFRERD